MPEIIHWMEEEDELNKSTELTDQTQRHLHDSASDDSDEGNGISRLGIPMPSQGRENMHFPWNSLPFPSKRF